VFLSTILIIAGLAQQSSQPQFVPPKPSLRGIHAVSDQLAWASGSNATIQRKAGKKPWEYIVRPTDAQGLDFRDIHAWDAKTAVIMSAGPGAKSRIYRTTDGGTTWKLAHQNTQEKGFFDGFTFWDRKRGILVGDPVDGRFTILTTQDGGASWQPAGMPEANEGEGAFAASGTSIAVGKGGRAWFGTGGEKGGRIFSSSDWGRTWQVVQTPIRHDSASAGIFSVAFQPDAMHGFAVGGDYRKEEDAQSTLVVTTDGGRTWTSAAGLTGFRSVVAIRGNTVFTTGPKGSDVSQDGGKTWSPKTDVRFHAASIGKRMVWLSGSEGRLAVAMLK
jgi:photosystem II stability/assembly factor-like uncharacterized protein